MSQEHGRVLAVHLGHSSNCSSMGSVIDVLFVSSVVGTGLLAALAVLLRGAAPPAERERRPPQGAPADEDAD